MQALAAEFREKGYVVLRSLFSPADLLPVRRLIAEHVALRIDELVESGEVDQAETHPGEGLDSRWATVAEDYLAKQPTTATSLPAFLAQGNWGGPTGRLNLRGGDGGPHVLLDECVYDLYRHPQLLTVVAALLPSALAVRAHGDYWFRPAVAALASATQYPLHQDSYNYGGHATVAPEAEPEVLSLWVPLADVNSETGCLAVVRGSHRFAGDSLLPMVRPVQPGSDVEKRSGGTRIPHLAPEVEAAMKAACGPAVAEPMHAGDVLAFHNLTVHGSQPTRIGRHVRWSVDLRYSDAADGYAWAADGYHERFPAAVVYRRDGGKLTSWNEWRQAWTKAVPSFPEATVRSRADASPKL